MTKRKGLCDYPGRMKNAFWTGLTVVGLLAVSDIRTSVVLASGSNQSSTVRIEVPASVSAARPFKVCVDGLPKNAQDWLTVVPASAPANTYAEWAYTQGQRAFCKTFAALGKAGTYEVRVYFDWPRGQYQVQARRAFRATR